MTQPLLTIEDLHVVVDGVPILKGVNLEVPPGEVHALMGPNGSGKSTLANVLLGHPDYEIKEGRVLVKGEDVTGLEPDERAKRGMFLAFQYPVEIPGVSVLNFLRTSLGAVRGEAVPIREFRALVNEKLKLLGMDMSFATRSLNEGFSGGEKKRNEVLQMALLEPDIAVLDETDSGLDIDAVRIVSQSVNAMRDPKRAFLVITHYARILNYLEPDVVHVLMDGRIVTSGGPDLAHKLEENGYGWLQSEYGDKKDEDAGS